MKSRFKRKKRRCVLNLNPIALRKTKIAYNFGFSECSRVEERSKCSIQEEEKKVCIEP